MVEPGKDQVVQSSTGEMEIYPDPFANVTVADADRAAILQQQIIDTANSVEINYLIMARDLSEFKRDNHFLALGYDTFRVWADSPDLKKIGYRSAQRLVQIADEVIPILEEYGLMEQLPPVSTMGDLLPILGDDDGVTKFVEAVKNVDGMSNRDAKRYIRELRGLPSGINGDQPTFTAKVKRGDSFHRVTVICSDAGGDVYTAGQLQVKPKDWASFEKMFNSRFIEYVD